MADAPERGLIDKCQEAECNPSECGVAGADEDPCKGCKALPYKNYKPSAGAQYASFLSIYAETFALSPGDLSWLDMDYLQAFQSAKNEFEKDTLKSGSK